MSEKEKDIIRRIAHTVPRLSREKQLYILGYAEGLANAKEESKKKSENEMAGAAV